jgi:ATP-binding cassette subfamily C protein
MIAVLAGMLVAALLEMVGIGAIPGFVTLLSNPERLFEKIPAGEFETWVRGTDLSLLTIYGAAALGTVFVVKNLYITALIYWEGRILRDISSSVAIRLFRTYVYCPYTFHLQRNPAELIRNVSTESVQAVRLMSSMMLVVREGLVLAVVFFLLLILDPLVSIAAFAVLGTAVAVFYISLRRSLLHRGRLTLLHRGRLLQTVNQTIGAIKDTKVLGRESYVIDTFRREVEGIQHHDFFRKVVTALPRLFLEVLGVASIVLVAAVFLFLGRSIESMLPVLALFAVGAVRLVPAFNSITTSLVQVRSQYPALEVVAQELTDLEKDDQTEPARGDGEMPEMPGSPGITIDGLHYRYPGASSESLRGVSVEIRSGEAIGFIGPSGAGKSTLVDVILGLLTPTSGEVRVDGRRFEDNISYWQRQIGYIPQDIYLIDDSIRRNIAFGLPDDQVDEDAIDSAIRAAQLESFVASLPEGLETVVGDRGIRLSGGQRQRIGIARAVYHNPRVLVMDEATSALDGETEKAVVAAIGKLRGDRTIITVAHRLTTVQGCDRVYLLEDGKISDQGSFSNLMSRHEHLLGSSRPDIGVAEESGPKKQLEGLPK